MSWEHVSLCWSAEISATQKLVLMCYAEAANKDAECWPSSRFVAKQTGLSKSAVQKARRFLIAEGFLVVVDECRGYTPYYRVQPTGEAPEIPDNVVELKQG